MKTKQQIEEKLEEARLYEKECEWMAECVATGLHPIDYPMNLETFYDLDAAFELSPETWMDKSVMYFEVAKALEWVLKD